MTDGSLRTLRRGRLVIAALVAAALVLLLGRGLVGVYVDALWFAGVGYRDVFWTRLAWVWGTRLVVGLAVAGAVFLNLRYAARTLSGIQIKRRFGNLEISEQLPRTYVLWAIGAVSGLLGLWFAASVGSGFGELVLFATRGVTWGLSEPVLGRDASFYVFLLPLLNTATTFLLVLAFLVFTVCTAGYAATGSVRWGKGGVVMGHQPRIHLGVVAVAFVLLLAARFWLGRYGLLLDGNSAVQGIFGYADARARLPALRILTLLTVVSAVLVLWGTWRNRLVPALTGIALVLVGGLVGGRLYPSLVQRFRVEPNELGRETPYIEDNLAFTRTGFGLDVLQRDQMRYDSAAALAGADARRQVDGLPVWSASTLLTTFREREARYPYYEFGSVDVDRYPTEDGPRVVAISVREVDRSGMDDPNWQNVHIRERYIAGMGAVVAAVTERTPEGSPPMYVWNIPPQSAGGPDVPPGLWLTHPSVYVGSRSQLYAVINPRPLLGVGSGEEADTASGAGEAGERPPPPGGAATDREPGVDFPRGIPLDSFLHTLALAWYERDPNLLFAGEVTDSSHFVMRREVVERASAIAPFLSFPEPPYPVIHEGRIVWILEGFTATANFPLSQRHALGSRARVSWVRNSVKVAVDGLTGEVRFYALPERDPLLEAYARAFPGLFTPFEEMPTDLRAHVRYSKAYMSLQATVLEQYHQNSAPVFHGQQDVWATPRELSRNTSPVPYRPEYGLYRLPGEETAAFHLTTVFVPRGRQNLTAFLAGRLDGEGRRRLRLLDIPVGDQAPGPRQVEALVEQDPTISQQFSLWRTGGSQVWTGHLHLVPVGSRIVYMEPIFLAAAADAIPELRRFVVSDGRRVAMEPTLSASIGVLTGETEAGEIEEVAPTGAPDLTGDRSRWPADALDLLDQAESRLRAGDWEGFGRALESLRRFLEQAGASAGGAPGGGTSGTPGGRG